MARKVKEEVLIGRFGSTPEKVTVDRGSTVAEVLDEAGIKLGAKEKVWLNGERAESDDVVEKGDIVSILSPKEAGL